ncbi:alpha/beta fold hydrolase [Solimonas soli]|uniref:alpha/beta fold hydrolase n=1 Tax=Solimonas soli TaxID=413479 RepID=UPI0004B1D349|nr:alpha/beta hydrolase [Solimonas soli]
MSLSRWRDTGSTFDFDGRSIFVHAQGGGDEALLLLHGLPTASWDFEAMWPGLLRRFAHVIAFDFLGFGFSDKPYPHAYSIAEQAHLAERLLAARGVTRVHLLAHSYGVCVAQELLARAREGKAAARPCSVVLLNGSPFVEAHRASWLERFLLSPFGAVFVRVAGLRRFSADLCALFGPQTQPGLIELHDYWTLLCLRDGRRVVRSLLHYTRERRALRSRWGEALRASGVPARLIYGAADPVFGTAMVERYRAQMPNADVVLLDGIGHFPHVEAPDRTLRAVLAFHDSITEPR